MKRQDMQYCTYSYCKTNDARPVLCIFYNCKHYWENNSIKYIENMKRQTINVIVDE